MQAGFKIKPLPLCLFLIDFSLQNQFSQTNAMPVRDRPDPSGRVFSSCGELPYELPTPLALGAMKHRDG